VYAHASNRRRLRYHLPPLGIRLISTVEVARRPPILRSFMRRIQQSALGLVVLGLAQLGMAVDPSAALAKPKSQTARAAAPAGPPAPVVIPPEQMCRLAIAASERQHNLPAGLLHAIGRVESGRGGGSWPWTINAEGRGRFFATKEEAIAEVQALQDRGIRVIDVGCMQVNLYHHPQAFASLQDAFDPEVNARYAGLFLTRLQAKTQDWVLAAGMYHSATPELAEPYRQMVLARWTGGPGGDAVAPPMSTPMSPEERRRQALVTAWNGSSQFLDQRVMRWNGVQMVLMSPARGGIGAMPRLTYEIIPFPAPPGRASANGQAPSLLERPARLAKPVVLRPNQRVEIAEAGARR